MCELAIKIPDAVLYDTRMTKEDFIKYLGENHVSIFHFDDEAEFLEEMKNA